MSGWGGFVDIGDESTDVSEERKSRRPDTRAPSTFSRAHLEQAKHKAKFESIVPLDQKVPATAAVEE